VQAHHFQSSKYIYPNTRIDKHIERNMTLHLQRGDGCWRQLLLVVSILLCGCTGFGFICVGVYVVTQTSSPPSSSVFVQFGLYVFAVLLLCHAMQIVFEHAIDHQASVDDVEDIKRHDVSQTRLFFEAVTGIEGWSSVNECFDIAQWLQRFPVRCALYSLYFTLVFYFLYVMVWTQASVPWYTSYVIPPAALTDFCNIFNTIFTLAAEIFFIITDLGVVQDALFLVELYTPIVIWRMRIRFFLATEYPLVQHVCGGNHSENSVSSIYTAQAVIVIWTALVIMLPFLAFRSSRFVFDTRIYWIASLVCCILTFVAMLYTADLGNEVVGIILQYAAPGVTVSSQPSSTAKTVKDIGNIVVGLLNGIDTLKGCTVSEFMFASATNQSTVPDIAEGYYRTTLSQGAQGQLLLLVIAFVAFLLCLPPIDVESRDPIMFHDSAELYVLTQVDEEEMKESMFVRLWRSLKRVVLTEAFALMLLIALMALAVGAKGLPVTGVSLSRTTPNATYPWPCYANYNEIERAFLDAKGIQSMLDNVVDAVINMNEQAGDGLADVLNTYACIPVDKIISALPIDKIKGFLSGLGYDISSLASGIGGFLGLHQDPAFHLQQQQQPHSLTNNSSLHHRVSLDTVTCNGLSLGQLLKFIDHTTSDLLEKALHEVIGLVYPLIDKASHYLLSDIDKIVVAVFEFLSKDLLSIWDGFKDIENILKFIPTIILDAIPFLPFVFVVFQCCVALVASLMPALGTMFFLGLIIVETQVLVVSVVAFVVLTQLLAYYEFQLQWTYNPSILLLDAACIVSTIYLSFLLYLQKTHEGPYIPYVLKVHEAHLQNKGKQPPAPPKTLEVLSPSMSSDEDAALLARQTVQGYALRRLRTTQETNAEYSLKPLKQQSKKKF
jgi:hypothetical protein